MAADDENTQDAKPDPDQGPPVPTRAPKRHQRATTKRVLLVAHRFAIFICALLYIFLALWSLYDTMALLRGRQNPASPVESLTYNQIGAAVGTTTVRESPLIKTVLHNSTAPVQGTIYLNAKGTSFSECDIASETKKAVFRDSFVRSIYTALTNDVSYNVTFLSNNTIELIVPVVDCVVKGADLVNTNGRFFYLVRQRNNTNAVSLLVVTVANQQYTLPYQEEVGPAAVAVLQLIDDMRATNLSHYFAVSMGFPYTKLAFRAYEYVNTTVDGLWTLKNVPKTARESVKTLQTSRQLGFYLKAVTEQSNINNYVWIRETRASLAVSSFRQFSIPVLRDSWAWVHGVQFFIAIKMLSNILILCLTTYHNIVAGKWWIGDAMVTVSNNQVVAGIAVLFSWFMSEFWSLHEFSTVMGRNIMGARSKIIYESHTRVDMLTMYLTACGLIGKLFHERIDPLVAVGCFLVGYEARLDIINWFPSLRTAIVAYTTENYYRSVSRLVPQQEKISPMGFWTMRPLGKRNYTFVSYCLFPIYITLVFIVVYVIIRKIYRRIFPEHIRVMRNTSGTATSDNEKTVISQKRVLTMFEIATGAKLEDRFGVVSDFEPSVYVRAVKHASPDGIYSTGFVIANGKFLIQTRDYWPIVLMKILRRRYTNIYVYEVNGRTVQQTARLVYPSTLTFADLLGVNVALLS